jgi:hypothetical protein
MNVLPSDRRITKVDINPTNRNPLRPQSSFFCNDGKDEVRHIFDTCKTIKDGLSSTVRTVGIRLSHRETMMSITTLTTKGTIPTTPLSSVFIVTFVWAVWSGRQHLFRDLKQPPPPATIVIHLETYTCTHLPQTQRKRTTPDVVIAFANNPPPEVLVGFGDVTLSRIRGHVE